MLDRLVIAVAIIGGLGLLWLSWQYYKVKLVQTIQPTAVLTGKPTLLFFSADYCVACKFQQEPIVEKVAAKFGESIAVKQYDVSEHPNLASQYKVLTLPTTVILDPQGRVAHINYSLTRQAKLVTQLSQVRVENLKQSIVGELQHTA